LIKVFVSYSHKDEDLRDALERHLALLKNEGIISVWYDRKILAGQEFGPAIDANLSDAQIVLLLVSADFLASSYCWGVEVKLAMRLHESNAAKVVPVILRACDWRSAPFGKILAAPKDGKPITSWSNMDEAFYDVAKQIRGAAEAMKGPAPGPIVPGAASRAIAMSAKPTSNRFVGLYCNRCGMAAGVRSDCTGSFTHHEFVKSGGLGAYCSRCGVYAGTKSICTGSFTHHNFVAESN
jgi:TIR domain